MTMSQSRIVLCAMAVLFMANIGCQDSTNVAVDESASSSTPETIAEPTPEPVVAGNPSAGAASTVAEPVIVDPTATVADAAGETAAGDATTEDPMPDSTELTRVEPTDPATVPAIPESETPEEPEPPAPLGIGDTAPPLAIATWVTGEPIDQLTDGQIYVVEFWATWCPPCRTSMPHLSHLQEQYGDKVQFVGVTREDVETVQGFLAKEQSEGKTWDEVVTYRLATDADDEMSRTYMQAAGQTGIPSAFIVGSDGVVEWIGHPMGMDQPLAKIVAGEWDRAAAIAEAEQARKTEELLLSLNQHLRAEEWDAALARIDEFQASNGSSEALTGYKVQILNFAGRTEEAAAMQAERVDQAWDNSQALNDIAWNVAIGRLPGDLALAKRAAERASELTDHGDASVLDTVARVHYELGDLDQAIAWQKKAVAIDSVNPQITSALQRYEAEKAEAAEKGDSEPQAVPAESESEAANPERNE